MMCFDKTPRAMRPGLIGLIGTIGTVVAMVVLTTMPLAPAEGAEGGGTFLASRMNEEQIRSTLDSYGMSDIKDVKRDGDTYLAAAEWYGKKVALKIDAATGRIQAPSRLEAEQVAHMLRTKGYTVREVRSKDDAFVATVEQRDQPYILTIDAQRGTILRQQAR